MKPPRRLFRCGVSGSTPCEPGVTECKRLITSVDNSFPYPSVSNARPAQGQLTTRHSQRAHAAESLRRAGRTPALQRRSALLSKRTRARGQASAPAPHLCKPVGLSLSLSFLLGAASPLPPSPCRGRVEREWRSAPVETPLTA